ncbi:hypothetical protein E2C01_044396 [Portunus trituberculatus]|uniref:Uncharacterized protein n=1 Tax=Portunus trituberculatus TaxID=210409 RepID=A0A5B7FYP9_PORTR|nr:hypothetical protein [Portunus trituberculatus]
MYKIPETFSPSIHVKTNNNSRVQSFITLDKSFCVIARKCCPACLLTSNTNDMSQTTKNYQTCGELVVYAELDLSKGEAEKKADVKTDEKTEYAQIVGTITDNREDEKKERASSQDLNLELKFSGVSNKSPVGVLLVCTKIYGYAYF